MAISETKDRQTGQTTVRQHGANCFTNGRPKMKVAEAERKPISINKTRTDC